MLGKYSRVAAKGRTVGLLAVSLSAVAYIRYYIDASELFLETPVFMVRSKVYALEYNNFG